MCMEKTPVFVVNHNKNALCSVKKYSYKNIFINSNFSELEKRVADIAGKPSGLFVPSGTMGNLLSSKMIKLFFQRFNRILWFIKKQEVKVCKYITF